MYIINPVKNILFGSILCVLLSSISEMKAQTIFSEDFESGTSGQFVITDVIGGLTWVNTTHRGTDSLHSPTHSMYFGDTTTWTYNYAVQMKASLVSSAINLSAYSVVRFRMSYYLHTEDWPTYFTDVASVQISNDSINFDTIASNYITINNLLDTSIARQKWDTINMDISTYAGDTIYIKIDFNTVDGQFNFNEGFYVDDIKIFSPVGADAAIDNVFGSEYTMIPLSQAMPITFKGRVSNKGAELLTNVTLGVDVTKSSSSVFTGNKVLANLPVSSDSLLTISTTFTPTSMGVYDAGFVVSVNENDNILSNDSMELIGDFMVTDTVFARDNGINIGGYEFKDSTKSIGQVYDLAQSDTLSGIEVFMDAVKAGDTINFSIFEWINDSTGTEILTTPDIILDGTEDDHWTNFKMTDTTVIPSGSYLFLINLLSKTSGSNTALGYDSDASGEIIGTPAWTVISGKGNPMLRLNLGTPATAPEDSDTVINFIPVTDDINLSLYPNPTSHDFTLSFNTEKVNSLIVRIYDLYGMMVKEKKLSGVINNRITINLKDSPAGIYFISCDTPVKRYLQKLILTQ